MGSAPLGHTTNAAELIEQVERARRTRRVLTLTGNTSDLLIADDGQPYGTAALLQRHLGDELSVLHWSQASGARWLRSRPSGVPDAPDVGSVVVEAIDRLCRIAAHGHALVLIDYADGLLTNDPDGDLGSQRLLELAADTEYRAGNGLVVLVDRGQGLPGRLTSRPVGVWPVTVGHPDAEARRSALALIEQRHRVDPDRFPAVTADDATVQVTGGLRIDDLHSAALLAARDGDPLTPLRLREVRTRVLADQAGDILRVHDDPVDLGSVANADHVVRHIHRLARRESYPRGYVLAGPPGTGKSYLVRAMANALGVVLVEFRQVHHRYVGESERRLDLALSLIDSLRPCAVWIDEIDQALTQRSDGPSGDSGTSQRMLARLWQFFGDTERQRGVVLLATTNRPDLLDTATVDRVDSFIPLLHPSTEELPALIEGIARQQGRILSPDLDLRLVARHPNLHLVTAREIHTLLGNAAVHAGAEPLGNEHFAIALQDLIFTTERRDHERMALLALRSCRNRSLLPWIDAHGAPTLPRPSYVDDIIDAGGGIDRNRLEQRLAELDRERSW